jgi:hypothetical protein
MNASNIMVNYLFYFKTTQHRFSPIEKCEKCEYCLLRTIYPLFLFCKNYLGTADICVTKIFTAYYNDNSSFEYKGFKPLKILALYFLCYLFIRFAHETATLSFSHKKVTQKRHNEIYLAPSRFSTLLRQHLPSVRTHSFVRFKGFYLMLRKHLI